MRRSPWLACKAVGLARCTHSHPDIDLPAWLRSYAVPQVLALRRVVLLYDNRREKVHRLRREEGLQINVTRPHKRAAVSRVSRRSPLMRRRWCGRSTSSSIPPWMAHRR